MNSFIKHSLCLVVTFGLVACSGSKSYQALDDFSYLETAKLRQFQRLPNQAMPVSSAYAIPNQQYTGAVGDNVSILPPVQLLKLISTGRYKASPYQAIFMLPTSPYLEQMNEVMQLLVEKEIIPVESKNNQGIETGWIELPAERGDVHVSYLLTPMVQDQYTGMQVTLVDAKRDDAKFTPTDAERERFNIVMANKLLLEFDSYIREKASEQAQAQVSSVSMELGADRSGNTVIVARADYDQFWDTFPVILEPLGFEVDDRNRSQGTVELDYSAPDDEVWQELGVEPIALESGKYQVQLGDLGNRTSINVSNNAGKPIDEAALASLAAAMSASMQ